MEILLLEALGIGAVLGLLLGLTGAGGSLVALPLLLSLHLPLRDAIGVSLGAVAITALIGAVPRARQGLVAWRPVLLLAIAGLPGNVAGQWVGRLIPEAVLILGFCALVLWTAWRMWRSSNLPREGSGPLRSAPLVAIGLGVGLFSGLMGVGGGFLVVPALLAFTPLSMLAATAIRPSGSAAPPMRLSVIDATSGNWRPASLHSRPDTVATMSGLRSSSRT